MVITLDRLTFGLFTIFMEIHVLIVNNVCASS